MIKKRDAETTKKRILEAAEDQFAEFGFAGTALRGIAEASGASVPLIVFHFKDKQGVYDAVKADIMRRYIEAEKERPAKDASFPSFLEQLLVTMFRFYRDNPTMIRLSNWGRLEGEVDPWPGEDKLHHQYCERIRLAQEQGEIRGDLAPLHISIMICGAVHVWWEFHEHFIKHMGAGDDSGVADEMYFQQCLAFVLRGLSSEEGRAPITKRK